MPASVDHLNRKPTVAQAKIALPKDLDKVPTVAWPTVMLCLLNWAFLIGLHKCYRGGHIPYAVFLPLAWASCYVSFTPAHDSTHYAVANSRGGFGWLNDVIGWIATLPLLAPFPILRVLHLRHHKYTNQAGVDPDLWTAGVWSDGTVAPRWQLPLRWGTIVPCYVKHFLAGYNPLGSEAKLSYNFSILVVVTLQSFAVLHLIPNQTPEQQQVTNYLFWNLFVPAYLALGTLAAAFDYIPHRPSLDQDIYKATLVTSLWNSPSTPAEDKNNSGEDDNNSPSGRRSSFKKDQPSSAGKNQDIDTAEKHHHHGYVTTPLTVPFLYQNYHLVHHLYPWVPFYKYSAVWYRLEGELRSKGAKVKELFPIF